MFKGKNGYNDVELVKTISEPTITIPENNQPTLFQTLGFQEVSFRSPTLLFSTSAAVDAPISVEDDDVIVMDATKQTSYPLLAYAKYRRATLVETKKVDVFQQLPSRHEKSLTCIKQFSHSVGHFLGQLSPDRFTLFTLN